MAFFFSTFVPLLVSKKKKIGGGREDEISRKGDRHRGPAFRPCRLSYHSLRAALLSSPLLQTPLCHLGPRSLGPLWPVDTRALGGEVA